MSDWIALGTAVGGGAVAQAPQPGGTAAGGGVPPPPPPPTHFHASGRRFTHNSSGQSKNPLTAITVSTAISEMSSQIIPLKGRTDSRESSRIPAAETIRVRAAALGGAARA